MPYKIPTANHQQQDDQQRRHEHQQGQPHVVPHLESWGVGAGSAAGGRAAGRHGPRVPEGSAPRGRDWAVRGRAAAGPARRPAPGRPGRPSPWRSGPRGVTTASSLRGAGATASGEAGDGRTRCHGGRRGGKRELEVAQRTPGPGCASREVPGDARCQPLPKAAAAAPPLPAPSP